MKNLPEAKHNSHPKPMPWKPFCIKYFIVFFLRFIGSKAKCRSALLYKMKMQFDRLQRDHSIMEVFGTEMTFQKFIFYNFMDNLPVLC